MRSVPSSSSTPQSMGGGVLVQRRATSLRMSSSVRSPEDVNTIAVYLTAAGPKALRSRRQARRCASPNLP
eukprot:16426987-Heterocapsa_arctica.AAC.1